MSLQINRSLASVLAAVITFAMWSPTLTNTPLTGAPAQPGSHLVYTAPSALVLM